MAFDCVPTGRAVTAGDRELVRVNLVLADLLGYPAAALTGRRLEELAPPAHANELVAARARLAGRQLPWLTVHTRLRQAAGRVCR